MNTPSIIVLAGIGLWLVFSLRYLYKNRRKKACSGCCSTCNKNCGHR